MSYGLPMQPGSRVTWRKKQYFLEERDTNCYLYEKKEDVGHPDRAARVVDTARILHPRQEDLEEEEEEEGLANILGPDLDATPATAEEARLRYLYLAAMVALERLTQENLQLHTRLKRAEADLVARKFVPPQQGKVDK